MNVGNGEVIDACRKGGLGRFVNHSCDPNAETQKWLVRGELAIGLFALRDIPAGSEITFDYNFERYGDKPLRCLCSTPACRGTVGGGGLDAAAAAALSSGDEASDAEHDPEPIMVDAAGAADPALAAVLKAEVGLAPGETPLGSRKKAAAAPAKPKGADSDDEDYVDDVTAARVARAAAKAAATGARRAAADEYDSDDDSGDDAGNRRPRRARPGGAGGRSRRPGGGGGGGRRRPTAAASLVPRFKRRSEVDRRLEALVGHAGRIKADALDTVVVPLLRLFNLCDVGAAPAAPAAAAGPAPAEDTAGGRRRARLADLSLLLDAVLQTTAPSARRALTARGALRQLHAAALRCAAAPDGAPVLRKTLRAAASLPLDPASVHARSSAVGSFGDALRSLAGHGDADVRAAAGALLARYPPTMVMVGGGGDVGVLPSTLPPPPPPPPTVRPAAAPPPPPQPHPTAPSRWRDAAAEVADVLGAGGAGGPPPPSRKRPHEPPPRVASSVDLPPGIGDGPPARPAPNAPPPPPLLLGGGGGGAWSAPPHHHHHHPPHGHAPYSGPPAGWSAPAPPPPYHGSGGRDVPPPPPRGSPPQPPPPAARDPPAAATPAWGARAGWGAAPTMEAPAVSAPAAPSSCGGPLPDSWPAPNADFEAHVRSFVATLAAKYARPDHPLAMERGDADAIAVKAAATIVASEAKAAVAHAASGLGAKPIDRRRLEAKAGDFVRDSVRRFHEKRAGGLV